MREESAREDLMREATALVARVALQVESEAEPVVIGFRRGGEASVFFGADPVYQFNSQSELRRAFFAGRLMKAERGALVELTRHRTEHETQLRRHPLSAEATQGFLASMSERLTRIRGRLQAGRYQVLSQVPSELDLLARVQGWLAALPSPARIASAPGINS
ncbi:MAG TPA: hypothetical protein VFE24_14910 [Pirellulales bacterium]|jgi:hypothetical protein|nr:hypothetical protein [Pirellulales bacterium]